MSSNTLTVDGKFLSALSSAQDRGGGGGVDGAQRRRRTVPTASGNFPSAFQHYIQYSVQIIHSPVSQALSRSGASLISITIKNSSVRNTSSHSNLSIDPFSNCGTN